MESENSEIILANIPKKSKKISSLRINNLISNHFPINLTKKSLIYLYSLKTEPEIPEDHRRLYYSLVKSVDKELKESIGLYELSGRVLFSAKKMENPKTFLTTYANKEYSILIKLSKETDLRDVDSSDKINKSLIKQCLSILVKRSMIELDMVEIGKESKFYCKHVLEKVKNYQLQVWLGFKTSVDFYSTGPKLLVDPITKILRTDNLCDYMRKMSREDIKNQLIGRSVLAMYSNFKLWRIDDIDFNLNPMKEFTLSDGKNTTYKDYYDKRYNIKIKDLGQPLVANVDRKTGKVCNLIPELLYMTGLEEDMKNDYKLMSDIAYYTKLEPKIRKNKTNEHIKRIKENFSSKQKSGAWNLSIENGSNIESILLEPPKIKVGGSSHYPSNGLFQNLFNARNSKPFYDPRPLDNWVISYPGDLEQMAKKFIKMLIEKGGEMGMKISYPIHEVLVPKSWEANLRNLYQKKKLNMIFFLGPKKITSQIYSKFKKMCNTDLGVPSQIITSNKLFDFKKNQIKFSVINNILIQTCSKIKGVPWICEIPEGIPKNTMLIGADVFHEKKKESVIGICATLNQEFSSYYSSSFNQKKEYKEIMDSIGKLVENSIKAYFKCNKALPETIIFYRDGLSQSQISMARNLEIQEIYNCFKRISKDYSPKFIEIIITKRINDRFYDANTLGNPPSGTIVHSDVVENKGMEFFMVGQNVNQGSCTPTRYQIIANNTDLTEDAIWKLSFYQCFNYVNWSGAIRVPAPAQYAHKLAYLVGQNYGTPQNSNLEFNLFHI